MSPQDRKRRRRRLLCIAGTLVVLLVVLVVGVTLGVTRGRKKPFKETFTARCKNQFPGNDCEEIFSTFQQAYVGKDHCEVPPDAYGPLFQLVPFKTPEDTTMFWSKTDDVVHSYVNKNKGCFVTMEDTLLGSALNKVDWCGRVDSSETFTKGCPKQGECENNPRRSFWKRASAEFAEAAEGVATVMMNGALDTPIDTVDSFFWNIELPRLNSTTVSKLTAVLVMPKHPKSNCSDVFFKELRKRLHSKIGFECKQVNQSHLEQCSSIGVATCTACW